MQNKYSIQPSTKDDLLVIERFVDFAIRFQKEHGFPVWVNFDMRQIENEIKEGLHYKLVNDEIILAFFSICFHDSIIWGKRETGHSIYLHRMVINNLYRGQKSFKYVHSWLKKQASAKRLESIRMDTWQENDKLITYYRRYGYSIVGNVKTPFTEVLPEQHRGLDLVLLEYKIK
ncbi:GNAT family N-acetyltransferase [Winogradskyella sp. 3972H.M.0a.05]|uniref:GNAT family N-acetyltransferase n=1 Tax=Winogradskyella sp. 3972H.M.0a.05 TaxID=2950277 RepID=UPI003391C2F0